MKVKICWEIYKNRALSFVIHSLVGIYVNKAQLGVAVLRQSALLEQPSEVARYTLQRVYNNKLLLSTVLNVIRTDHFQFFHSYIKIIRYTVEIGILGSRKYV